ncbi:MAG TPA: MOSC domain-containing protein [Anaerolineales bacterium]|jgi:MOSC domain-containing protein YiiM|nr:MOSC domain-containing protein [Anaerolineales bacterium]
MKLISVNIGQKRTQLKGNEVETTGIYKSPAREPVEIKSLGIQQDFICDHKNHGGPDQAIYIYGAADYVWWSKELGQELGPGTFGDNLTISELESASFNIGDRLHIGSVILEVTAPRIPCSTLAARMRDPQFVKKYSRAERPGLYCRVIQEGIVQAGDEVKVEPYQGETLSILEMFRSHYHKRKTEETLRRILRAPIDIRSRTKLEEDLQELLERA